MIIPIKASSFSYDVLVEDGSLNRIGEILNLSRRVMIVTDDNIPLSYLDFIRYASKESYVYTIPHGEKSKCFEQLQGILKAMLEKGFNRKDCVVALGGGVVGDLAGFAASMYMRGVDFYSIPTTVLSMVDSSIGGKTAIDFAGYKNSIGAFYPPKKVVIDTLTLKTLPEREIRAGLVEAIKMAATFDESLFHEFEATNPRLLDFAEIIGKSLLIKKHVVEEDERESGLRKALNFGHTFGHAIESYYEGKYLHGECVGMGMLYLSEKPARDRILAVLNKYHCPVSSGVDNSLLLPYIKRDKKSAGDGVDAIVCEKIGTFEIKHMSYEELLLRKGE